MKRKLTLRFGMILFAAFLLSSINSLSAADRTRNCSTPLNLLIPNNGKIVKGTQITVHIQLQRSANVKSLEIKGLNGVTPADVRTEFSLDGKVDVDIIIRGENFLPFLYPYSTSPAANISIAEINYITVDNISGVFETNTNPTTDISSRLVDIMVNNGDPIIDDANAIDNSSTPAVSTGIVSVLSVTTTVSVNEAKAISTDNVHLFPNPVRDNLLNLSFPVGSASIQGLRVFNALGALVYQDLTKQAISGVFTVQLPNLPAGVYFVRVATESNEVVKKFNITR